jgi:hypothetical protein
MTIALRGVLIGVAFGVAFTPSTNLSAQRPRQAAQPVDPMTASIKGVVTAADTGAPLRGAEVRLSSRSSYNRLTTSDGEGIFNLRDLPAGEYRLTVSRTGFTSLVFGQRRPLESPVLINLSEGEVFTANLALTRGGTIHGRIIDQFGEPIAGTRVQALRSRMVNGQRRFQSMGPGDQTDDTGAFRVYGLPPGDYYMTASVGPVDAVRRQPPVYYPGTPSVAEAQPITIAVGAEVSADFQLAPLRHARVSGVVFNASGAPVQAMVSLASQMVGMGPTLEATGFASAFMINADAGPDGRFTIEDVPPGPYTLTANSSFVAGVMAGIDASNPRSGPNKMMQDIMERGPETASMPVVITGDDVADLTLTTRRGGALIGTFVADSGVTSTLPTGLSAQVRSLGGGSGMSLSQGGRGSEFRLAGMSGPFQLDIQGVPDGWAVSQITVDGIDVSDEPIELRGRTAQARVVLTNRITTLSGVVQSPRTPSNYSVVVFPDDAMRWTYPTRYVRTARPDDRGRFRISGLPPGERYYAVAVDYLEDGEEQDVQLLERLRGRAVTFSLGDNEQRSVVLEPVTR